jgi:hypothetical protein
LVLRNPVDFHNIANTLKDPIGGLSRLLPILFTDNLAGTLADTAADFVHGVDHSRVDIGEGLRTRFQTFLHTGVCGVFCRLLLGLVGFVQPGLEVGGCLFAELEEVPHLGGGKCEEVFGGGFCELEVCFCFFGDFDFLGWGDCHRHEAPNSRKTLRQNFPSECDPHPNSLRRTNNNLMCRDFPILLLFFSPFIFLTTMMVPVPCLEFSFDTGLFTGYAHAPQISVSETALLCETGEEFISVVIGLNYPLPTVIFIEVEDEVKLWVASVVRNLLIRLETVLEVIEMEI